MKQIIKTAGAIMEQLRILTGWKFVGGAKGDVILMAANLVNKDGVKIQVALTIENKDVEIKITALNGTVSTEDVERIATRLDFPVKIEIREGASFSLVSHEPLGVLEFNVRGVVTDCIVPMADVVAEAVSLDACAADAEATISSGSPETSA